MRSHTNKYGHLMYLSHFISELTVLALRSVVETDNHSARL